MKARFTSKERVNNNIAQTFYFTDSPITKKDNNSCFLKSVCTQGMLSHPITRQQTQQQKKHKHSLNKTENQMQSNPYQSYSYFIQKTQNLSKQAKIKEMKGQLQQGRVQMLLKDNYTPKFFNKLIASDCNFKHSCFDSPSSVNQYANYKKATISRQLKLQHDIYDKQRYSQNLSKRFIFIQK